MTEQHDNEQARAGLDAASKLDLIDQKMTDVLNPGVVVEFDPDEAEMLGLIEDDAMTEQDAWESNCDLMNLAEGTKG